MNNHGPTGPITWSEKMEFVMMIACVGILVGVVALAMFLD
jgi:hypothetical protein